MLPPTVTFTTLSASPTGPMARRRPSSDFMSAPDPGQLAHRRGVEDAAALAVDRAGIDLRPRGAREGRKPGEHRRDADRPAVGEVESEPLGRRRVPELPTKGPPQVPAAAEHGAI